MKKILIVEDDLLQKFFLKKTMEFFGHKVIGSAVRGTPAIKLATELHPDIILMDIQLSGELNGIEAATQILKKVNCFIIYITGSSNEVFINQAKETHSSTILSKPVSGKMIDNAIHYYFST